MLQEFTNPYKALQEIAVQKLCGHILITDPRDATIKWRLYLGGKRLHYATTTSGQVERIGYLWHAYQSALEDSALNKRTIGTTIIEALKFQTAQDLPASQKDNLEYATLYNWSRHCRIQIFHFKQLLKALSLEALIQAVSIVDAKIEFHEHPHPEPILMISSVPDLLRSSLDEIQQWRSLKVYLPSPFARFYLDDSKASRFSGMIRSLDSHPIAAFADPASSEYLKLVQMLVMRSSLYEISHALNIKPLELAKYLEPFLKNKTIQVLTFQVEKPQDPALPPINIPSGPIIACIDDSKTVQRQVKMTLEHSGYQVLGISDPASSLTTLVRQKPALILMDINMPDIDGYELCRMLRQSRHLRDVPIVMFTGRDGLIDRARSQLSGAVGYLTKPVEVSQLLDTVKKFV